MSTDKTSLGERLASVRGIISDMDGVIYHGNRLLPGVPDFVRWLQESGRQYLFLTNSSERSPRELQEKLRRLGLDVPVENFLTSALATAGFLRNQVPGGSVYAVGEAGLISALYDAGFSMNDVDPDYVVIGETRSYSFEKIEKAINLVNRGARLIGTNPDLTGPVESGIAPACGALIKPVELATGKTPYFVGKPNPLMMRQALKRIECRREESLIVGDRMDTDVIAGVEAEIETVLVLSGVTSREEVSRFAYQPRYVLSGVDELVSVAREAGV
ncbi:HAD family hydrolase [Alkalispirochaeta sphaeroplastigenens]|uniref:HAD family hydrolase n=1 Tax=Alkalispirochaeta sphaeroplastigenens TaxID=1187066 RepID=A0A2S4JR37_9SPIO|nr:MULTISPECIES: HAD-IIA family hydrolase [Alkalispirochaeta]POR01981.1 HAD family hydrolase [Alkalispirochaeta sphaeroplastigenens]